MQRRIVKSIGWSLAAMLILGALNLSAQEQEIPLTAKGKELFLKYTKMLDGLRAEIAKSVPSVDPKGKAAFMDAFAAVGKAEGNPKREADVPPILVPIAVAQSNALERAQPILSDVEKFLSSDKLDDKLVKCSILADATPWGLAEFAQQGDREEKLVDELLGDTELMKRMLVAGGAQMNRYGDAMRIYKDILKASEHAREKGILNRFALGTSLALALPVRERAHTNTKGEDPEEIDPVERYLHYEKAYLDGELDPAFSTLTAWECRFIPVSACRNEELAWGRKMLRTYRPDHVLNKDYKWRYSALVKTDVKYGGKNPSIPELGFFQDILNMGGVCGRRAFFGRFIIRAFGMPAFGMTQRGHAAVGKWTPNGWTTNFGAHWRWNWWTKRGYNYSGLHFFQESQARRYPDEYMKVLRAQWVSDTLGEVKADRKKLASGGEGGFWDALSLYQEKAIIAKERPEEVALAGEDLAEANEPTKAEKIMQVEITDQDKTVSVDKNGVITIPAAACSSPTTNTAKIVFMKSFDGGMQMHYNRLGKAEPFEYTFDAPSAGIYLLTAKVATVNKGQQLTLTPNGAKESVEIVLPYTVGLWDDTQPVKVSLVKGKNMFHFTRNDPNYGATIKEFVLTPMK